jgi:hypothetical protein
MMLRNVMVALVAMLPMAVVPTPALAGGYRIPLQCGMAIREDAEVYLQKDTYCRSRALFVEDSDPDDDRVPLVIVDLNGHTLRAAQQPSPYPLEKCRLGIDATGRVRVSNGRIENWCVGISSASEATITDVKVVGNDYGIICRWAGRCDVDFGYFRNNSSRAIVAHQGGHVSVNHSIFSRNFVGVNSQHVFTVDPDETPPEAPDSERSSVYVRHSIFYENRTAAELLEGKASFSYTKLVKNETAFWVGGDRPEDPCPVLYKTRLVENGIDFDFTSRVVPC